MVTSFTAYGFAAKEELAALLPMAYACVPIFIIYLIFDLLWVIFDAGKKLKGKDYKTLKYITITFQVFTLASIYLGMAIGNLLR